MLGTIDSPIYRKLVISVSQFLKNVQHWRSFPLTSQEELVVELLVSLFERYFVCLPTTRQSNSS